MFDEGWWMQSCLLVAVVAVVDVDVITAYIRFPNEVTNRLILEDSLGC